LGRGQLKKYFSLVFFLCVIFSEQGSALDFPYDLHLTYIPGHPKKAIVCFHGMGGSFRIIRLIQSFGKVEETLVGFNFPDHHFSFIELAYRKVKYGTMDEILPALHVLKKIVIEDQFTEVSLYGFSAGGGAIVNILSMLNSTDYDEKLQEVGIGDAEKALIIAALQKGNILLDAPLKSIAEVRDFYGQWWFLHLLAAQYKKNGLEPIENLHKLQGLCLRYIVQFQAHDEVLSNRDDALFIERLRNASTCGSVFVIIDQERGHRPPHPLLWDYWRELKEIQGPLDSPLALE
jgi:hypothetical protein